MNKKELIQQMLNMLNNPNIPGFLCHVYWLVKDLRTETLNESELENRMLIDIPELAKYKPDVISNPRNGWICSIKGFTSSDGKVYFGREARIRILTELLNEYEPNN